MEKNIARLDSADRKRYQELAGEFHLDSIALLSGNLTRFKRKVPALSGAA